MPLVDVTNLSVRFGSVEAVTDVSLSVASGEIVALLGPNGAGKTTTLEAIQGYNQPSCGTVTVLGHDPSSDRSAIAHRWGVMPQSGGIPMGLTVGEAVGLFSALHGYTGESGALLRLVGLEDLVKRRWRRLSGGEQQRLSLALALCGGTDLLLLDEPTAAVDPAGRNRILEVIRERAAAGAGVLLTTHRFDDVEAVADRVVIIHHGRLVASGDITELTANSNEIRFSAAAGLDVGELGLALGRKVIEASHGAYVVDGTPDPSAVAAITAWLAERGLTLGQLQAGVRRLEDVYLELTADD